MSIAPALRLLLDHKTLSSEQMRDAFRLMLEGAVSAGEIGAFLALLATRIPTGDELVGAAEVMRAHVDKLLSHVDPEHIVDTCGTGGAPKTFNVSSLAAIVAAAAGARVAKHGNRSRTGRGSGEVLDALGIRLDAPLAVQAACLDEVGICFCFAQRHHPAMRSVAPVRKELPFPTIFNVLGPLTNPAGAKRQLLGVYDARFLEPVAHALRTLGASKAVVVHSDDGLDELSISSGSELMLVTQAGVVRSRVVPEELGLTRAPRASVVADDLAHAVRLAQTILAGDERGAPRDAVLMSAGAALFVDDKVSSIAEGVLVAGQTIDSGAAQAKLVAWARASHA